MPIAELIKGHETAVLSGSFALFGVFITLMVNVILKCIENKHSLRLKRLELAIDLEKTHLLEPVLEFIDHDLGAMQAVYSLIFVDKKKRNEVSIDNSHLPQLPAIQARLIGLGDHELSVKFREFSQKRLKIGNAVEHPDKDPYEELVQAISLAGEIMNRLFDKLKNLEK